MRIGFAGAGNMAAAMARGWAAGDGGPEEMLFCDLEAERARPLAAEVGGRAPALISVLAATPTGRVAEAFPGVPVLRVMPNQPVEVRRGVLCYAKPEAMPAELEGSLLGLLGLLGTLVPLEETQVD